MSEQQLLTRADVANILAVSLRQVDRYIHDGKLKTIRLGSKAHRIAASEVDRFIDAHKAGGEAA
jgi:excisionase family DNA binding protein